MLEVVFYIFLKLYQFSFWKTSIFLSCKAFLKCVVPKSFPRIKNRDVVRFVCCQVFDLEDTGIMSRDKFKVQMGGGLNWLL